MKAQPTKDDDEDDYRIQVEHAEQITALMEEAQAKEAIEAQATLNLNETTLDIHPLFVSFRTSVYFSIPFIHDFLLLGEWSQHMCVGRRHQESWVWSTGSN